MLQSHQLAGSARSSMHSRPVVPNARSVLTRGVSARHHLFSVNQPSMIALLRSAAGVASRSSRVRAAADAAATAPVPQLPPSSGPVMVWFQHDLRVADHPGLLAAAGCGAARLVPFFCLDPRLYGRCASSRRDRQVGWRALRGLRGLRGLRACLTDPGGSRVGE
ncbi:hypothetical protein COO60DRAFT_1162524 [Scenedesmus sp. NREL 46B-D3]|nr:hypothetical protein COO60DRAFT_1162524 [Scenedesmus sp. NREL 46B-D3]